MSGYLSDLVAQASGARPVARPPRLPRIYAPRIEAVAPPTVPVGETTLRLDDRSPAARSMPVVPELPARTMSMVTEVHSTEPAGAPQPVRRAAPSQDEQPPQPVTHTQTLREVIDRIVAPRARADEPEKELAPAPSVHATQQSAPSRPGVVRTVVEREAPPVAAMEANVTNIHIGRVELTAIAPAPPRVAPRPQGKAPMSLEEYLRRRDGNPR